MPRPSRRTTSGSAALGVLAVTALLLTGCAADAPPSVASLADGDASTAASPTAQPAVDLDGDPRGLRDCMTEQGVPIAMPTQEGNSFTYQYPEGVPMDEVDEALGACARFLPGGGAPPDTDPERLARLREIAECMRAEGIEEYPDPNPEGVIDIPPGGLDPTAPDFVAAQAACVRSDR